MQISFNGDEDDGPVFDDADTCDPDPPIIVFVVTTWEIDLIPPDVDPFNEFEFEFEFEFD